MIDEPEFDRSSRVEDAYNLGWKLAYVLREIGSEELLDSFDVERVAAMREHLPDEIELMKASSQRREALGVLALALAERGEVVEAGLERAVVDVPAAQHVEHAELASMKMRTLMSAARSSLGRLRGPSTKVVSGTRHLTTSPNVSAA